MILLEFLLLMWFSYDANSMYRVMTPDEYMNGIIYFYTDLVLIAVVCAVFVGITVLASACGSSGGFGTCQWGSCHCCSCCVGPVDDDGGADVMPAAESD